MRQNLLFTVAGMILLTLGGCKDGVVNTPTTEALMQPTYAYEIDIGGRRCWLCGNSKVYEFTPKSNPDKTCVMFMLDNGNAMGLECFNKKH